jgi:hypothetical protein
MKYKILELQVGLVAQRRVTAEKMVVGPEAVGLV